MVIVVDIVAVIVVDLVIVVVLFQSAAGRSSMSMLRSSACTEPRVVTALPVQVEFWALLLPFILPLFSEKHKHIALLETF